MRSQPKNTNTSFQATSMKYFDKFKDVSIATCALCESIMNIECMCLATDGKPQRDDAAKEFTPGIVDHQQ